jgi:carboxylesterase type B
MLDQHLALNWVQKNIGAFNGNPKKVTIFGESAGAVAVDALITAYPDKPPFRAAILQSGQTSPRGLLYGGGNTTQSWFSLASALNCSASHETSNLTCIRKIDAAVIKHTIETNKLGFTLQNDDGVTIAANSTSARLARKIANIPILTGTTSQEGRVFVLGANNLTAFLQATFPGATAYQAAIAAAYPPASAAYPTDFDAIAAIYTDVSFTCVCEEFQVAYFFTLTNKYGGLAARNHGQSKCHCWSSNLAILL